MKAIKILVFVIVMGTFSSAMLVGVNSFTKPLIEKNEEIKLKTSILDAFDVSYSLADVLKVFEGQVRVLEKRGVTFYNSLDGAVAFEFNGPGLWGGISGIVCLEKDLNTIRKIKITHQEETPGLGSRIAESDFLKQFKKKVISPRLIFMPEGKAANNNEVDAITGATGTSRAFEKLINENLQKYLAAFKE